MCREHAHWWVLAPPDGPTSVGRCKLEGCGAERVFANSTDIDRVAWKGSDHTHMFVSRPRDPFYSYDFTDSDW